MKETDSSGVDIVLNSFSTERGKEIAQKLSEQYNSPIQSFSEKTLKRLGKKRKTFGIGGDGTQSAMANVLVKKEYGGTLIVVDGGSQNGFHAALVDGGNVVSAQNLGFLEDVPLQPLFVGEMNHEYPEAVIHGVGVNPFLYEQSESTNALRFLPIRKLRGYLGGLWGFIRGNAEEDDTGHHFRLIVTSQFMGPVRFPFTTVDLFEQKNLAMLEITGKDLKSTKFRGLAMAILTRLGIDSVKQKLVSVHVADRFDLRPRSGEGTLDGEPKKFPIPKNGIVYVKRSSHPLKVAAFLG